MFEWYWVNLAGFLVQVISSTVITVWIHRTWCHRGLNSAESVATFSRFWLWMVGWYWPNLLQHFSATHRKHHARSDRADDPHSPFYFTFNQLVFEKVDGKGTPGKPYYMPPEEVQRWASDVPTYDDWLERRVFRTYPKRGPLIVATVYLILFGWLGLLNGLLWIFFTRISARMHNYMSHKTGYRNWPHTDPIDKSVNIVPIGILWGGEEFGANHHDDPQSPRFSRTWFEFDIGWVTVLVLGYFGLVEFIDDRQVKDKWYLKGWYKYKKVDNRVKKPV